jgi:hypothetical protein
MLIPHGIAGSSVFDVFIFLFIKTVAIFFNSAYIASSLGEMSPLKSKINIKKIRRLNLKLLFELKIKKQNFHGR